MTVPEPPRLKRYGTVLARWLLIALSVFGLTTFSGLYVIDNLLHKTYTATARIQIRPGGEPSDSPPFRADLDTMRSANFLKPIITDLQLDKIWAKRGNSELDALPAEDALEHLNRMLKLHGLPGANIIDITVSSAVPEEAADIANAIADRYVHQIEADRQQLQSPVRILSRAEPPEEPSRPNKRLDFLLTLLVAGFLGASLASFVEIVLLFLRAAEAT
jgi:capsular polysaccharide biosynthesis protein